MNGELENLRKQLEKAQKKLATLQKEKIDMDDYVDKGGKISESVANYYNEICKLIYAAENVVGNIENQIKDIEENSTYRLLGENIPENKQEIYDINGARAKIRYAAQKAAQQSAQKEPKQIDEEPVIDVNLEEPVDFQKDEQNDLKNKNDKTMTALKAEAAALLVGIGAVSVKLAEEVKKTNNQENTTMEQPVTQDDNATIAYDYEENVVTITPEPTVTPVPTPSNPFINVAGYNEAYLKDYEDAMNRYNILAEKAVDYVNRAHIIQDNYYFFAETSINETVEVIMAIDQRELMTDENNNVADSINSSLNTVLDGALWKGLTDADIAKLDAIPYFAEEGTDLNIHLKEYARLAKDAIVNQTEEAFNNMYQYLQIFTLSQFDNTLAVNIIEPDGSITERPVNESTVETVGTVTRELYDAATVNNVYDWWIACNSFIKPLYTTYFPYDYSDERVRRWEDLECIMNSGMEDPKFDEVCGNSLTLGGE